MRGSLVAMLAAAGLAACGGSPTGPGKWSDPTTINYYSGLHVSLTRMSKTATGVFYWDSVAGTGTQPVHAGDQIKVRYTLWLPDGTQVDNGGGVDQTFTLDTTNLIPGWVDGLTACTPECAVQGTTRQLVIPPGRGYGDFPPTTAIPANATLVFLITLDQITPAVGGDVVSVADAETTQRITRMSRAGGGGSRFP